MTVRTANQKIAVMKQVLADNEVLKLLIPFIDYIKNKRKGHEIDYCVFGKGSFHLSHLLDARFYKAVVKRIVKRKVQAHH